MKEDWPKNPVATDLPFPYARGISGWYSQATGLLFHACRPCILRVLEISAVANDADVNEILGRTYYFVNSQWITTEENCLDKIYFKLRSRGGGRDLDACPRCKLNLCLSVIYREFNCLDKSDIVKKRLKICYSSDMMLGSHEEVIVNILRFVSGLSFGYYLANLMKDGRSSKRLNEELIFLVKSDNNKNNVNQ